MGEKLAGSLRAVVLQEVGLWEASGVIAVHLLNFSCLLGTRMFDSLSFFGVKKARRVGDLFWIR